MKTLHGFKNIKEINQSKRTIIYSAQRNNSEQNCVIKIIKEEFPSPEIISRIQAEFNIAKNLPKGITVEYFETGMLQERPYIVMEDTQAVSLKTYIKENKIDISTFFEIAIKTATALGKIHEQNIIHKDINSNNILINPETCNVYIIDFNIATKLNTETIQYRNHKRIEGTIEYISPEQTGRMNRSVDYRSDYYSLGITLYELLYNKLPFRSKDAIELIHSHIAKKVEFTEDDIKKTAINRVIKKLLEKNAENRYQSIYGLINDLEKLSKINDRKFLQKFEAGRKDILDKLQIPEKLYGREKEISIFTDKIKNIIVGEKCFQLIKGESGVGKTALVNEIQKYFFTLKANYIKGKCEQFIQNVPYKPLIQALSELVKQILSEPAKTIELKKQQLLKVLDGNGKILTDLIPELELIIGKQKELAELGSVETQNITENVFMQFIRFFSKSSSPLIIFIDDLHRADLQTLNIIKKILTDDSIMFLNIIGAYRDNETDNSHPLILTLKEIEEKGKEINNIKLQNLKINDVENLLKDTFKTKNKVKKLADLIIKKTSGNPFFIKEFLKEIYKEGNIVFDFQELWKWDIEKIKQMQVSDNVVELMESKLLKLPENTISVLKNASLISVSFNLQMLSSISKLTHKQTNKYLWNAVEADLIEPIGDDYKLIHNLPENEIHKIKYRFQHNRVQEASYKLIPENERSEKHLNLARLLLKSSNTKQTEDRLFDIANHYNNAINLLKDEAEKKNVFEINLNAAEKAKASTAYETSYEYLKTAEKLLLENNLNNNYKLSFRLYKELGECEHLVGNNEKAIDILSETYKNAQNNIDKLQIAILQVGLYTQLKKFEEVSKTVISSLKNIDIIIPENEEAIEEEKVKEMRFFENFLEKNKLESLANNISNDKTELLAANLLITALDASILFGNSNLGILATYKIINRSITNGVNKNSASGFAVAGMYANIFFDDFELSYKLGNFGYSLSKKLYNPVTHHKVLVFHGFMCAHFKEPFSRNIEMLQEALKYARQNGDYAFANFALVDIVILKFSTEENISDTKEYILTFKNFVDRTNIEVSQQLLSFFNVLISAKQNLKFSTDKASKVIESKYNDVVNFSKPINYYIGIGVVSIYFCEHLFITKQYRKSLQIIEKYPEILGPVKGFVLGIYYYFYYSLSIYKNYNNFTTEEKDKYNKILRENLTELKKYSEINPQNYLHYYSIAKAEQYYLEGKKWEAVEAYELGIKSAQENNIQQIKALANELLADFYFAENKDKIAFLYLRTAHFAYKQRNELQKAEILEIKYPELSNNYMSATGETIMSTDFSGSATTDITTASSFSQTQKFDLTSAMKFAQNISKEVQIGQLLKKLMSIIIENAGADKGYLLLNTDNNLYIAAEAKLSSGEINVLQNLNISSLEELEPEKQLLALNIINYTNHTKETLVIDNASEDIRFAQSGYIQKFNTKSVLCMPIIKQTEIIGILYLENTLVTNAFTQARLLLLENLSSQIAISIENALLYENLEQKVKDRTAEINSQKEEIQSQAEELQAINEEIQQQAEELQTVNDKLKELDTFKETMVGMIVHDLKNPLNSIIGLAENETVRQSGKSMLNMVSNILDVQKYEDTEIHLQISNYSISEILDTALQEVNLLYEQKNLKLINNIKNYFVIAEKEIIERIFINILTNAIKYSPNNGTILIESDDEIKDFIRIKIANSGDIIPEDKIAAVFGKFQQIVARKSGLARSSGLGLTFCKLFAEAHGGKIGVETNELGMTSFWFTLPAGDQKYDSARNIKIYNTDENKLKLKSEDKEILNPYLSVLKELEVYDYTEIVQIIEKIDFSKSQNLTNWKKEMDKVLFAMNEEKYNSLIRMIDIYE